MVAPQTKVIAAGCGLFVTVLGTFNGFIWQVQRKRWKEALVESWNNMGKLPLKQLPPPGEGVHEFMPVEIDGTLDNEGSVVVGPRPMPLKKQWQGASDGEQRAGFLVLTPFQEDNSDNIIMVNRGWVPIDSAKSRIQRVQYTGDGFKHITLRGFVRKEESLDSWWAGENTDANKGASIGVAWLCCRPYEVTLNYYERRWGANTVPAKEEKHGARHWMVEMCEDHSGDDQRMIKGAIYPVRRTTEDLTHTNITPLVHSFYAAFWLTVCGMSCFMMRKVMVSHRREIVERKVRDTINSRDTSDMQRQQAVFNEQLQQLSRTGGRLQKLDLKAGQKPQDSLPKKP